MFDIHGNMKGLLSMNRSKFKRQEAEVMDKGSLNYSYGMRVP